MQRNHDYRIKSLYALQLAHHPSHSTMRPLMPALLSLFPSALIFHLASLRLPSLISILAVVSFRGNQAIIYIILP
jgi:hypothetical protein